MTLRPDERAVRMANRALGLRPEIEDCHKYFTRLGFYDATLLVSIQMMHSHNNAKPTSRLGGRCRIIDERLPHRQCREGKPRDECIAACQM